MNSDDEKFIDESDSVDEEIKKILRSDAVTKRIAKHLGKKFIDGSNSVNEEIKKILRSDAVTKRIAERLGTYTKIPPCQTIKKSLANEIFEIFKEELEKGGIEIFKEHPKDDEELAGININESLIEVFHKDLERFSSNSLYKSNCPKCKRGILLIYRDTETFVLQEYDRCILCGQQYRYLDIEELRKKEK